MILHTDALSGLRSLADKSVHCIVSSPPYFGLRSYGTKPFEWPEVEYKILGFPVKISQITCELGQEPDHFAFIGHLVLIFREAFRVLRDDGTAWINMGDSYAGYHGNSKVSDDQAPSNKPGYIENQRKTTISPRASDPKTSTLQGGKKNQMNALRSHEVVSTPGLKPKDLIGIPWMLAMALRDDGWFLRQDIIWAKPNGMPESVTDRCTKSHEYVFMLSKNGTRPLCWRAKDTNIWVYEKPDVKERMENGKIRWEGHTYYYDAEAIKTEAKESSIVRASQDTTNQIGGVVPDKTNGNMKAILKGLPENQNNIRKFRDKQRGHSRRHNGFNEKWDQMTRKEQQSIKANKRSVWTISPAQYPEEHFAVFPEELIWDMILAGCPPGGVVLDPFFGRGTTGVVARKQHKNYIGIELLEKNIHLAEKYLYQELGMFK